MIRKISIKQNNRLVRARVYNLANFERHYSNYDYNILKPLVEYKPDIIIFQLGENYKRENDELYFKQLVKLINYFGNDNISYSCRKIDDNLYQLDVTGKTYRTNQEFKLTTVVLQRNAKTMDNVEP